MSIIGPLLFVGSVLGAAVLLLIALVALLRGRARTAGRLGLGALAVVALYAVVLVTTSLASTGRVLAMTDNKKFCAADCDLWFAVEKAEHRPGLYVVTVKVISDAARVTMKPSDPKATLIDERGTEYQPSDELDPAPFARPVGPHESYTKTLAFHVPDDLKGPSLYIQEGGWITKLIVGDENSFLHRKTLIRL